MIKAGRYYTLKISRSTPSGVYLDDGENGILLPNRYVPANCKQGDEIKVFIYHDSEDRLIATTAIPKGIVGDIVKLPVVSVTPQGAFMNWGLMKDIFVPNSQQKGKMIPKGEYIVKIYEDEKTGRIAATEKFDQSLSNQQLSVKENEPVQLVVYRRTDIGYVVIINNKHTGVLHHNEIYRSICEGDKMEGFIKKIYPDNKIDVVAGKRGYERNTDAAIIIIEQLKEHGGFLPFHDKSNPDDIYSKFGISKKVFKTTTGNLYKQRIITINEKGITLISNGKT